MKYFLPKQIFTILIAGLVLVGCQTIQPKSDGSYGSAALYLEKHGSFGQKKALNRYKRSKKHKVMLLGYDRSATNSAEYRTLKEAKRNGMKVCRAFSKGHPKSCRFFMIGNKYVGR